MHELLYESRDGLTYGLGDLLREIQPLEERAAELASKPTRSPDESEELRRLRFDILDQARNGFARVIFKMEVDQACTEGAIDDVLECADKAVETARKTAEAQAVLVRRVVALEKTLADLLKKGAE